MANGADGHITLKTFIDTNGVSVGIKKISSMTIGSAKKIAGAVTAITSAAAVTATAAFVKSTVDAYADYEQLTDGVKTLFKGAYGKVMTYAEEAYKNVGLSANEYMQNVTTFSAALISSLGGDTEAAADVANMALTDIADNVNKMGSSYESVQLAFQGFAKQQYMLLDNLKLGYGGTKTEMERLLKNAQKITGVKYDINNLADVYNAIHVIQTELDITGTTADEAAKTVSGSAAMMKAAFKNVVTAIGGGGAIEKSIAALADSIEIYIGNIEPVFERAIMGIGKAIEKLAPIIVQKLTTMIITAIPSILNAIYQMIVAAMNGIIQGVKALFTGQALTVTAQATEQAEKASANTAKNMKATGKAADKAAKDAKKMSASFDELNVLSGGAEKAVEDTAASVTAPVAASAGVADITGITTPISEGTQEIESLPTVFIQKLQEAFTLAIPVFDGIKEYIMTVFSPAWEAIKTSASNTWENLKLSATAIFESFPDTVIPAISDSFTEDIIPTFAGWVEQMSLTWDTLFSSISEVFALIVTEGLAPFGDTFAQIWSGIWDGISTFWDEHGAPIFAGIQKAIENIKEIALTIWETYLKPVIDNVRENIEWLWNKHLKPLWDELLDFFGSVAECVLNIWNNFLAPIVKWLWTVLGPKISWVINGIVNVVSTIVSVVVDVIKAIIRQLKGIVKFISGVFSGDWEEAWNGIKEFFGGVWDQFYAIVKGAINLIIDGINFLWGGLYTSIAGIYNGVGKIVEKIGDMVDQDWGFSMPTKPPLITKLAKGGIVTSTTRAIIGEAGKEAVLPLENNTEWMDTLAEKLAEKIGGGVGTSVDINFTGTEARLIRYLAPKISQTNKYRGKNLLTGGQV